MKDLYPIIGKKKFDIKNVIILGGSSIGQKTARNLCQDSFNIKLIEESREKAENLAEELEKRLSNSW